jgi:hypothetical protein
VFAVFILFLDDKMVISPYLAILSSRNDLNIANTFFGMSKQLTQSNSDNCYLPQTEA